jgi:hypothetical protein
VTTGWIPLVNVQVQISAGTSNTWPGFPQSLQTSPSILNFGTTASFYLISNLLFILSIHSTPYSLSYWQRR